MAASKDQVAEARLTVERIVARLGGRFSGDGSIEIRDVATLEDAEAAVYAICGSAQEKMRK